MNILYLGDIMGRPGREVVAEVLPDLRNKHDIDLVIAQAENVSHGKSMTPAHMDELMAIGVDFFTGGNHSYTRENLFERLKDPKQPVIGVANLVENPADEPGHKIIATKEGNVLVVSLLGSVFPPHFEITSPLKKIDEILETHKDRDLAAIVVNMHSDYSSEKVIVGDYLDGRVSLVVGDHWHVPTADARVLPGGTAHMTDVGMCGVLNSSLGVEYSSMIPRWRDEEKAKRQLASNRPYQFNAILAKDLSKTSAESTDYIRVVR